MKLVMRQYPLWFRYGNWHKHVRFALYNHEVGEFIARIMPALVKTRLGTEDDKTVPYETSDVVLRGNTLMVRYGKCYKHVRFALYNFEMDNSITIR